MKLNTPIILLFCLSLSGCVFGAFVHTLRNNPESYADLRLIYLDSGEIYGIDEYCSDERLASFLLEAVEVRIHLRNGSTIVADSARLASDTLLTVSDSQERAVLLDSIQKIETQTRVLLERTANRAMLGAVTGAVTLTPGVMSGNQGKVNWLEVVGWSAVVGSTVAVLASWPENPGGKRIVFASEEELRRSRDASTSKRDTTISQQ